MSVESNSWASALEEAKKRLANGETLLSQPIEFIAEMAQMEKNYEYIRQLVMDRINAKLSSTGMGGMYCDDCDVFEWVFPWDGDGHALRHYFAHKIRCKTPIRKEDWFKTDFSKLPAWKLDKSINECAKYTIREYERQKREWEEGLSDEYWMISDGND